MSKNFQTVYCTLSKACLRDTRIVSVLNASGFKASSNNTSCYYKVVHEARLEELKNKVTVFFYKEGKRREIVCRSFSSIVAEVEHVEERNRSYEDRNQFCGYN